MQSPSLRHTASRAAHSPERQAAEPEAEEAVGEMSVDAGLADTPAGGWRGGV